MKKLFFFFLSLIFSACIFSNEKSNEQKKVPVFDSCLVQARRSWCEDLNRCAETVRYDIMLYNGNVFEVDSATWAAYEDDHHFAGCMASLPDPNK